MKCPHCGGNLIPQPKAKIVGWDYDCEKCGRSWKINPDGSLESMFATDKEVIPKGQW